MDQNASDAQLQSSFLSTPVGLIWIAALALQLSAIVYEIDVVGWIWDSPSSDFTQDHAGSYLDKSNDVRFQWANDLVWNSASNEKEVFYDQSILTLDDSTAVVKLDNGIELELPERSMIAVRRPTRIDNSLVTLLTLGRGRINVRKVPNKVQVRLPRDQGKITLEKGSSADITLVKPESGANPDVVKVKLQLHEGDANVVGKGGVENIKKGNYVLELNKTSIELSPSEKPQKANVPADATRPVQKKKSEPQSVPVPVKEKREPPPAPEPPSEFNQPKFKTHYFHWKGNLISAFWSFLIPHANANANADAEEHEGTPVELSWEPVPNAVNYEIEVARTRAFRQLLGEGKTNINRWEWVYHRGVENTKGRVFYRVRSISQNGVIGPFSEPVALPIPLEIRFGKKNNPEVEALPDSQSSQESLAEAVDGRATQWLFSVSWGYQAYLASQTSDSELRKANLDFPSQVQMTGFDLVREHDSSGQRLNVQAYLSRLEGQGSIANTQPDLKLLESNIRLFWKSKNRIWIWDDLGISVRRSNRFVRVSSAEVEAQAGWTYGLGVERRFLTNEEGCVRVDILPFGVFGGGPATLQVQASYPIWQFDIDFIRFSIAPDFYYRFEYWKDPPRTRVQAAGLGFSITGTL